MLVEVKGGVQEEYEVSLLMLFMIRVTDNEEKKKEWNGRVVNDCDWLMITNRKARLLLRSGRSRGSTLRYMIAKYLLD